MNNVEIGKLKVSQVLPYLKEIALETGLRLHYAKEFKFIYKLFVIRHFQYQENNC
jgi:hypothetical protein